MKTFKLLFILLVCSFAQAYAQNTLIIEGYVYEEDDRGFIRDATVKLFTSQMVSVGTAITDEFGHFVFETNDQRSYIVRASSNLYFQKEIKVDPAEKNEANKVFLKMEMERQPGYIFDVTLAEPRPEKDTPTNSVEGATIEIYNNTTKKMEWVAEKYPSPYFKFTFQQGNHYTIVISKERYITKQIEAYVNVNGCIVCIDGVDNVKPGVVDNLTEGHQKGTLLANIELRPVKIGEKIPIGNLYYKSGRFSVVKSMHKTLNELIVLLVNNPSLIVELRSHTDSQGDDDFNQKLSLKRAKAAVKYIMDRSDIDKYRLKAVGMGETSPVNKCKNKVPCTDKELALNRRTELVITGLLANKFIKLPLTKQKEKEKMAALLADVMGGEQIQIPEGEEMPEDLKRQLEKEAKGKSNEQPKQRKIESTSPPADPIKKKIDETKKTTIKEKDAIESKKKTDPEKSLQAAEERAKKAFGHSSKEEEGVISSKKKGAKVIEQKKAVEKQETPAKENSEKIKAEKTAQKPQLEKKTKVVTTKVITTFEEPDPFEDEIIEEKAVLEHTSKEKSRHGEIKTEEPKDADVVQAIKSVAPDFTGYRVQIKRTPYELPNSDIIFKTYSDVVQFRPPNGDYIYLTGNFATRTVGKVGLSYVQRTFPKAKLRLFKKGKMMD